MNGSVAFGAVKQYVEEIIGGTPSIFLGYVTNSFPNERQDGTPLLIGDFVRGHPSSEFPLIINGVKLNTGKDRAVYQGSGKWEADYFVYQNTKETPLTNKRTESMSGLKLNQKEVNEEMKNTINDIKGNFVDGRNLSDDAKKVITDDTVDGGLFNEEEQ